MRTQRASNYATYRYFYNGGLLVRMTKDSAIMRFTYDASGMPMSVVYGGEEYFYATNLQSDVVALLDGSGDVVVRYTYDAWGNILSIGGDLADTLGEDNPLRYRGYVYDTETGLYYLQSRYYNPEWGRFITADSYISTGQGVQGCNVFAYCNNNPVLLYDPTGNIAITISVFIASIIGGAIAGATINTISYLHSNENTTVGGVVGAFTIGAITGGLGGAAGALGGSFAIGLSITAGVISGAYTAITTDGPLPQKLLAGITSAVITGGGAYLGSLIPLDGLPFGLTVAGNTIFGLTIGGYLELANVTIQGWVAKGFENQKAKDKQNTGSTNSVIRSAHKFATNPLPKTIPICV